MSSTFPGRPPPAATSTRRDWSERRERSNMLALRLMAWIALHLGRRVARLVLHPICLYFLAFAPAAARHSKRYLARALGRTPTLADRYRHIHAFASTVLDRVYFVRGALHEFELDVSGGAIVDDTLARGGGAFLLGAHIGSFEALHTVGATRPGMRVAMVMYPDNAQKIQRLLQGLAAPDETDAAAEGGAPAAPKAVPIIAIGRAGSTLAIRDWLDGGGLAGLLGDRLPPTEPGVSTTRGTVVLPFLGAPAPFADGPLRLAQLLRRRVIFMSAVYRGGRRYEVRFEELVDFARPADAATANGPMGANREAELRAALEAYVQRLEAVVRDAPYNWFNFHDFWGEDAPGR